MKQDASPAKLVPIVAAASIAILTLAALALAIGVPAGPVVVGLAVAAVTARLWLIRRSRRRIF